MQDQEWWLPRNFATRKANLALRVKAIAALRGFFAARDYIEVETPCLQISPGMEPHLMAFATTLTDPYGGNDQFLYLHTSPEFAMKKLLAAGMPKIWQMAHVFRNNERSATHHPEFTMVEWYQTRTTLSDCMDETADLVRALAEAMEQRTMRHGGKTCDPFAPWRRLSVAEAFDHYTGIDILAVTGDRDRLAAQAVAIGISVSPADAWEDVFFKIMMDRIEPHLGADVPTFLHSYPVAMAALARPSPADDRVAERFELYACGVELANAFDELTDPVEQRRRFTADMDLRERLYQHRYPVDEAFLAALEHGLPQSVGIALGFDRLIMTLCGADSIDQVLWAPVG